MYSNINAERGRLGLSKSKLSDMLNVDRKTLDSWQKKGRIPSEKLLLMANIFDVSVDYLLGRSEIRKQ